MFVVITEVITVDDAVAAVHRRVCGPDVSLLRGTPCSDTATLVTARVPTPRLRTVCAAIVLASAVRPVIYSPATE